MECQASLPGVLFSTLLHSLMLRHLPVPLKLQPPLKITSTSPEHQKEFHFIVISHIIKRIVLEVDCVAVVLGPLSVFLPTFLSSVNSPAVFTFSFYSFYESFCITDKILEDGKAYREERGVQIHDRGVSCYHQLFYCSGPTGRQSIIVAEACNKRCCWFENRERQRGKVKDKTYPSQVFLSDLFPLISSQLPGGLSLPSGPFSVDTS